MTSCSRTGWWPVACRAIHNSASVDSSSLRVPAVMLRQLLNCRPTWEVARRLLPTVVVDQAARCVSDQLFDWFTALQQVPRTSGVVR